MPADTSGFAITSSTSSGSFDDVRRPTIMLLQPDLGGCNQPVGDSEQPRLAITMLAPIHRDGFEAQIDGGEMRSGGDAGLAQG